MAYNYFPQTYQTPIYYPTQSNAFQSVGSVGANQQQNSFVQWVQGINAAKSFPVAPNTSIPLFDSEANVIYIKSADASGMPSIKILDYVVRDTAPRTAEISTQSDFATKNDISILEKEISSLKSKFERMSGTADKRKERTDGK